MTFDEDWPARAVASKDQVMRHSSTQTTTYIQHAGVADWDKPG